MMRSGAGVGLFATSSHQYVSPGTTANVAGDDLPGKVATLPLMLVSNSVSNKVLVAASNVSNAKGPPLYVAGTCHVIMGKPWNKTFCEYCWLTQKMVPKPVESCR